MQFISIPSSTSHASQASNFVSQCNLGLLAHHKALLLNIPGVLEEYVLPLVVLPAEAAAVAAEDEAVELPLEDGSLLYEYMSLRAASLSWRLMAR